MEAQAMLSASQVARMLGCSQRHVLRLVEREAMPAPVRLGRLARWKADEVNRWIAAGCPESGQGVAK